GAAGGVWSDVKQHVAKTNRGPGAQSDAGEGTAKKVRRRKRLAAGGTGQIRTKQRIRSENVWGCRRSVGAREADVQIGDRYPEAEAADRYSRGTGITQFHIDSVSRRSRYGDYRLHRNDNIRSCRRRVKETSHYSSRQS